MASTAEIIVKKVKELEEVTGRPSLKRYPFFGEGLKTHYAIDTTELIPLLSGKNIGPKK